MPAQGRSVAVDIPSEWERQIHQLWQDPLVPLPEGLKVHPSTAAAFASSRQGWGRLS